MGFQAAGMCSAQMSTFLDCRDPCHARRTESIAWIAQLASAEVMMTIMRSVATALAVASLAAFVSVDASDQQQPVPIPQSGVPQIMTLEGKFVRVAYNNEGYVIIGYQIANRTIGDEWIHARRRPDVDGACTRLPPHA